MPDKDNAAEQTPENQPETTAPPTHMQPNNPLHGVKLADMLEFLVEKYGWQELGNRINLRCFNYDPSIKSSLAFLRQTQWARDKVEGLYLRSILTAVACFCATS
jgi:uncharacterized protein (DUF2132 family)